MSGPRHMSETQPCAIKTALHRSSNCEHEGLAELTQRHATPQIDVGLLTGGQDRHYAFGLAMALISRGVCLDFIGSDEVDSPELHDTPKVTFLNLRGNQRRDVSLGRKLAGGLVNHFRL